MRWIQAATLTGILSAACIAVAGAADGGGHVSCTGSDDCLACMPACQATWGEAKSRKPKYSMKCEYGCVRGRDSWHAPPPECRSRPPCGDIIVKKRLYKTDGPEKVERVPKYEVETLAAEPCRCISCIGHPPVCWWNPVHWITALLGD